MPDETVFKMEERMEPFEIAEYLREIADRLEREEPIDLSSGAQSVNLETSGETVFEVEVERDREDSEEKLELEIEWKRRESSGLEIG